jgi:hypothetical protein
MTSTASGFSEALYLGAPQLHVAPPTTAFGMAMI